MDGSWGENGAVISRLEGAGKYIYHFKKTYDFPSSHSHGSVAPIAPFGDFSTHLPGPQFSTSTSYGRFTVKHTSRAVHSPSHQIWGVVSKGPFADGFGRNVQNVSNNWGNSEHKSPQNVLKERIYHSHICSMYGIFSYTHTPKNMINVGKCSTHGASGILKSNRYH